MPTSNYLDDDDEDMLFEEPRFANTANWAMIDMHERGPGMTLESIRVRSKDSREIKVESDIVTVRNNVKRVAALLGFSPVNQTKIVTAASEIARNTLDYGGGGTFTIEVLDANDRRGIKMIFEDEGPGIADIEEALQDGYTSGSGMGLGLGGSKRLMDDFRITSTTGEGTRVEMTKWS
jgi:serine/threonine-protein kinase RsbT